jgi:hypothetical protein
MASAAGVAAFPASLDLAARALNASSGEPDSARITGNPEVMPLDQYRETRQRLGMPLGAFRGGNPLL